MLDAIELEKLEIEMAKTDDEIYQMAMQEWIGVLVRLWDAVGKPVDADRLEIYRRELRDVPLGLLEKAVDRVIKNHSYANVPIVHDVWKAVRAELGNPIDVDQAILNWCDSGWDRIVYRFDGGA